MLFNQTALNCKRQYLDSVLTNPSLVETIVGRHICPPFRLIRIPRVWEPGGGATLFRIEAGSRRLLLKVKHRSVLVESRLESEPEFQKDSSLRNEYTFLVTLGSAGFNWVPHVEFLEEAEGFEFLAVEWLTPFSEVASHLSFSLLLTNWDRLKSAVNELFARGIVHTDIHEHNLCFRGNEIVLVDFEEARFLRQDVSFTESLDVVGANRYGNVGNIPESPERIPGLTCLNRMEQVLTKLIRERLPDAIARCNFDHTCPYNLDPLQKPDSRIYQSLEFDDLTVAGQRPLADRRPVLLSYLVRVISRNLPQISHLDIGSNLGVFCFALARLRAIQQSVGVEASDQYVDTSKGLAFVYGQRKVKFIRLVCGEEPLPSEGLKPNVVTMFSVYHHVADKDRFLNDLKQLGPKYLIAEFPPQTFYYPERKCLEAEIAHIRSRLGFSTAQTVSISTDYSRPIVVFSSHPLSPFAIKRGHWITSGGWMARARTLVRILRSPLRRLARKSRSVLRHSLVLLLPKRIPSVRQLKRAMDWTARNTYPRAGVRVHAGSNNAYPEVTGYYVPSLLNWGAHDRAVEYAKWLMSIQNADGSWSAPSGSAPYTFDTGQVLKGLLAVLSRLPEAEAPILRGCDWMLARIESSGRITTPDKSCWGGLANGRMISENIHLYALEPLRDAGKHFNRPQYLAAVDRALAYYLAQPDLTDFNTLSHFHAYVLEALVDLGHPERAMKGMDEVERLQRTDGSVPAYRNVDWVCSTGVAQYAVIWYKLGKRDLGVRALDYVRRLQNRSGGFYGSYGRGANYFPSKEISWAVKYFLDAYYWHIRTAFDSEADNFPGSIESTDGRLQAVVQRLGNISGLRVLDAGCGKGRFARALLAEYPSVDMWGVDLSDAMLRCVPPPIRTKQGSLLNLPFPDCSFDCVFSVEALEHAVNPQVAVKELCRVLKPGGKVVIVDKNKRCRGALTIEPWEQWFDHNEVKRWLTQHCQKVDGRPLVRDPKFRPDGLFVVWQGEKH